MKRTLFIIYLTLISLFCNAQKFNVKAHIIGLKNDSLLVLKIDGKNTSAEKIKVADGKFEFEGAITEPYFLQLFKIKNGSNETEGKLTEFLAEVGNISILGKSANFEDIQIKGSSSDKVLKAYLKEDQMIVEKWSLLKLEYDKYVLQKDSINRKLIARKLNDLTFTQRVPLLKSYVVKYNNNIVGALLPNFCMLQDVLKKEDYIAMYNTLSETMKLTNYGKSIYDRTK